MRHRPEIVLIGVLSAFALTGTLALLFDRGHDAAIGGGLPVPVVEPGPAPTDAVTWFAHVRPFCNAVEVDSRMRLDPAPATPDGAMYEAACHALAGRIGRARELIVGLPPDLRVRGAGVVFEAGHPAADAGDDVAAGPLMELVVEFWPNHYMALYHAGAARYDLGDYPMAREYLERFLLEYATEDGWRASAREMLARIASMG